MWFKFKWHPPQFLVSALLSTYRSDVPLLSGDEIPVLSGVEA